MLFKLLKDTLVGTKTSTDAKSSNHVDVADAHVSGAFTKKFNMGCGHNKLDGFINVDAASACKPDVVCNLETVPWPFESSIADQIIFNHSLEHMGQTPKIFLGMMQELYRMSKNGAKIIIHVPHPRHDNFLNDPTHVRPITAAILMLFDKELNDKWQKDGSANSPLAHYLDVNFKLTRNEYVLAEPYQTLRANNQLREDEIEKMAKELNNIISENRFELIVIKS
jgi:predicted SAM-dependent methyltransferase